MQYRCMYCGEKVNANRFLIKFPLTNDTLLKSWYKNLGLDCDYPPHKSWRLCSDHFTKDGIKLDNKKLISESIPNLFNKRIWKYCACCGVHQYQANCPSFHTFPENDAVLLKMWLKSTRSKGIIPSQTSLICSNHFENDCYRNHERRKGYLKKSAVPTVFGEISSNDLHQESERLTPDLENPIVPETIPIAYDDEQTSVQEEMMVVEDAPSIDCNDNNNSSCREEQITVQSTSADHNYATSPGKLKRKLLEVQESNKRLKTALRNNNQKIVRMKKKISSLKDIVSELKKTKPMCETGFACLESIANNDSSNDVSQFLERYCKNAPKNSNSSRKTSFKSRQGLNSKIKISREQYPPSLRSFAMTLHFYSPKAYSFIRRKFCFALPHPSSLRAWYSTINGEPGFTVESFDALKHKVEQARSQGKEVLVSLMSDEMGIKKSLQYLPNGSVRGYVNVGTDIQSDDTLPLAKNALVLLVVCLHESWKIPIGYFLVNGVTSKTHSSLITEALIKLHEIGVKVTSITLDGPQEHFSTMKLLGANFNMPDPKPFFNHPISGEKVHVILDPCHMLKLMRNCLGDMKVLKDKDGNLICWKFIEELAKLQEDEGLRAANKVRMAHILYFKSKMKVNLAAQTLSSSTADAIDFCFRVLEIKSFEGSEATVKFIRVVDRLFDFLNSRSPYGRGFKAPLRKSNETFWRQSILEDIEYLKGITNLEGTPMYKTRRYVPFVGFITAVESVISLFDTLVSQPQSQLSYLLTYKFSQDHLELFFCAIRKCGGWCPNPTASQFVSAYKRLLVRQEIEATNGNVIAMDSTKVLSVSSSRANKNVDRFDPDIYDAMQNMRVCRKYGLQAMESLDDDNFMNEFEYSIPTTLSSFSETTIGYIAGWVIRKLIYQKQSVIWCESCRQALLQSESQRLSDNRLIEAKSKGGLIFPSQSVVKICKVTEIFFRNSLAKFDGMIPSEKNFPALLCSSVLQNVLQPPCTLFTSLNDHMFDNSIEEVNHIYLLSKQVCKTYIQLRMFAATKSATYKLTGVSRRHHMNRQIIWAGQ